MNSHPYQIECRWRRGEDLLTSPQKDFRAFEAGGPWSNRDRLLAQDKLCSPKRRGIVLLINHARGPYPRDLKHFGITSKIVEVPIRLSGG